jgi:uncharacterized protein YdeI (YjbR/CyaY-like superfamily)
MTITSRNLVHVATRKDWRAWLEEHFRTDKEVWLVYFKKETRKTRISYNDAVEEALCFGWIDSIQRTIDNERFAQRFSPRRTISHYSEINKMRLRALVIEGKVETSVLAKLGSDVLEIAFKISPDVIEAIKSDKDAWGNFQNFSEGYKRIRIGFIEGARNRPTEFQKRLRYFIKMTALNKKFGYGGVERYY